MRNKLKRKFSNRYKNLLWNINDGKFLPNGVEVRFDDNCNLIRILTARTKANLQLRPNILSYNSNFSYDSSFCSGTTLLIPVYLYSMNRKSTIQGTRIDDRPIGKFGFAYLRAYRLTRDDMFKTFRQLRLVVA